MAYELDGTRRNFKAIFMEELFSLLIRFAGYVVIDLLIGRFFYAIGWPFVKVATIGRYPREKWASDSRPETYVCCVGAVIFVFSIMAALGQFSV